MARWGGRPRLVLHRPGWDVLTLLCVLLVLGHSALALLGGVAARPEIYQALGLSRSGVLEGKLWQLVSHAFIHGNWTHVIGNTLLVYFVGGAIHRILGGKWLAAIFFAGVLGGGGLHLLLHPSEVPLTAETVAKSGPLVGASGGGMALLVALTVLAPDARAWPFPVSGRNIALGVMFAAFLLYLFTPTLGIPGASAVGQFVVRAGLARLFQLAHACHLGGGLAGFFLMRWFLRKPVTLAKLQRERAKREGTMAA